MRLAVVIATVAVLAGCRSKKPRPDIKVESAGVADAGLPIAEPALVRITLLDSGARPREPVRYQLRIGDSQTVVLRLRYRATNRLRAAAQRELVLPAMKLAFHIEIVEAILGDSVRYRFDLIESSLADQKGVDTRLAQLASDALTAIQGIRGSAVVDSHGVIRDGTIESANKLDPAMQIIVDAIRTSMEQLAIPLPDEAVGVGAKWELRQSLVQGGTVIDQTTIYELTSRSPQALEVSATIQQQATRQDVVIAGVENAELIALEATGKTTASQGLSRIAPTESQTEITSETSFEFAKPTSRRQALVTKSVTNIGVKSQ